MKAKDITGQVFGRLTVLKRADSNKHGLALWKVQCSCEDRTIFITVGNRLRSGMTKSCGCLNLEMSTARLMKYNKTRDYPTGPESFAWKGGRTSKDGYVYIYKPEHPYAIMNGCYINKSRFIAEKVHGLLPQECVFHHVNSIRDDNRPENIWVFENQAEHVTFHNWAERQKQAKEYKCVDINNK